ncbi:glycosyltransferase family 2 protein [Luteimonas sp. S4-F44]|uniref:glycosyltransferase family 2 protein n=1 Tax=Luteimonas sp. S4-F44 TaxID=2925842 RepID=UPI001F532440|nr:glycosyltransferase family 2 protein [Luteimonas sp. S4-F44]UNK41909.1 glycosyltransferase family 2 protein [Luteimonas sp. S4-F44]
MTEVNFSIPPPGWVQLSVVQLVRDGDGIRADGSDPQLLYAISPALRAGWYRLRITVAGELHEPCVYLDCGHGFSEAERQDLDFDVDGIDAVVRVDGPLRHLRFDPTTRPGKLVLGALRFDPLQPAEAAWRMARTLRESGAQLLRDRVAKIADRRSTIALTERPEQLWPVYRQQDAHAEVDAYRRWVTAGTTLGSVQAGVSDGVGESETVLTMVLLADAPLSELRKAVAHLAATLPASVQILAPAPALGDDATRVEPLSSLDREPVPGIDQADGRFISWISADERVSAESIVSVLKVLDAEDDLTLLYTDEDFLSDDGRPLRPYFKPAWDRDLQQQHDFVGPSAFYSVSWLLGLRRDVAADLSAWCHLLPLHVDRTVGGRWIRHLPIVGRHHLSAPGPAHSPLRSKPAAPETVAHALEKHRAPGVSSVIVSAETGMPRVRYARPPGLRCDVIVPTRDRVDLLSVCVDSVLARSEGIDLTVTVVDNGSVRPETFAYFDHLREDGRVRIVRDDAPFNYSALNNRAAERSGAQVLVLLNNDVEIIDSNWLREIASHAMRDEVGAVGAKLLYPDHSLQHAGVILGVEGVAAHAYTRKPRMHPGQFGRALAAQRFSAVTAACLAIRREVFEAVGGLDEHLAVAFNDVDFCLRVEDAGYRNLWLPWVVLYHHESASRGYEDNPEKQARFDREVVMMQQRWADRLEDDPAYNPNLALVGRAFSLDPARRASPITRSHHKDR